MSDYQTALANMKTMPGNFMSARIANTTDCDVLANAAPAAIATNTSLLVGVWAEPSAIYSAEKDALFKTLQQHGYDWLLGVNVGFEDAYLDVANMSQLRIQIFDVKGMIGSVPGASSVKVGHIDDLKGWTQSGDMSGVIDACDSLG